MTTRTRHRGQADQFYIDRNEQRRLSERLRKVPGLVPELDIAVMKQDRLGGNGRRGGRQRPSEQPLPYSADASDVYDRLHSTLVSWARLVCEQRGRRYLPVRFTHPPEFVGPLLPGQSRMPRGYIDNTSGVSRWLDRHLIALAMTEGADRAYSEISDVVREAEVIACPPAARIVIDEGRVAQARRERLNAHGIGMLAKELGEEYRNLTERRVQTLHEAGKIREVPGPWLPGHPTLYVVGDVMDAHLLHPIRKRDNTKAAK